MASSKSAASKPLLPDRRPAAREPSPLPSPTRAHLAVAFGQALDLAEGRRMGHGARVCYIALHLAQELGLAPEGQRTAFYAALLHDAGAAAISAELWRLGRVSEEAAFRASPDRSPQQLAMELAPSHATGIVGLLRAHPQRGAEIAADLGFSREVRRAIAAHHERWDGRGYPKALKGDGVPAAGRIVATSDLIESLLAGDMNVLAARRNLLAALGEHAGRSLDPELAGLALQLTRSDAFWLGLCRDDLAQELAARCPGGTETATASDFETFAVAFADLADAKGEYTTKHAQRTAELAVQLGEALGLPEERRELLRIAALVHDVGLLGVPARIIAKPDILSLTEMQHMRQHPTFSQQVLETLPGLEEAARWVGAHHERPDGKGYPEMLEDDTIPVEGRIIALADTYVALTSPRPYRRALSHEDAQQVLLGGAGTQLDRQLVQLFCTLFAESTSSRSARRPRRRR